MRKTFFKRILISALVIVFIISFLTFPVFAQDNNKEETKNMVTRVLPTDQTIEGNYLTAGDSVTLSGTVNGDAYVAGGNVLIEGTVNGDLLVAGGNVTINGNITEDVRFLGGNVNINGNVGGSISGAGGQIAVQEGTELAGSLVTAGGMVSVYAPTGGEITAAAGVLNISNQVNGDIKAAVGQLTLTSSAVVNGDLMYRAEQEADIQQGATVSGQTNFKKLETDLTRRDYKPSDIREGILAALIGIRVSFKILGFLSAILTGLLMIWLAPDYSNSLTKQIKSAFWKNLGIGFAVLFLTPIAFVILMITVIGIPLGLITMALYMLTIYFSRLVVSLFIGKEFFKMINQKNAANVWAYIVGLIIYTIVTFIPFIGGIASLLAVLTGMGAIVIVKQNLYKSLHKGKSV